MLLRPLLYLADSDSFTSTLEVEAAAAAEEVEEEGVSLFALRTDIL